VFRSLVIVLTGLSLFLPALPSAAQGLEEAQSFIRRGAYDEALDILHTSALPHDAAADRLTLGRLLWRLGRFDEADVLLSELAEARRADPAAVVAYAALCIDRGEYSRTIRMLEETVDAPRVVGAQAAILRAEAQRRLGRYARASRDLEAIAEDYHSGGVHSAEHMAFVGMAFHGLELYVEANTAYSLAVEMDPETVEARVGWAALLLEKYEPAQANATALEVLALNPHEPRALVLSGRARLALDHETEAATRLAEAALAVNPNLAEAHELLAEIAIENEEYEAAIELLQPSLVLDPNRIESLTPAAAAMFLLDDSRAFRRIERQATSLNPDDASFHTGVGDFAARAFRNDDAVELYRQALERDAGYWPAYIGLGIGLSRLGDDDAGADYLRQALENDPFDARAYRMVQLYEHTLIDYEFVPSDHFRFRFHRDERPVLETYVPPLLESVYLTYVERYGFDPEGPISVEIFADAETFAVRSAGVPHVGPHGLAFSHLVTSRSPSEGDFDWAEVLAHELSHVFTLQLSRARVPRWLSEGLADFDTGLVRPEWRRHEILALLAALEDDRLLSIAGLNRAFRRVDDVNQVLLAYYESALAVRFLVERWGEDTPVQMLRQLAEPRRWPDVLEAITGLDISGFDDAFESYCWALLASWEGTFEPHPSRYRDEARAASRVAEAPLDAQAYAELAMAKFLVAKVDECESAFLRALEIDPTNPLANFLAGSFAIRERRYEDAVVRFEAILEAGFDGYSVRTELGTLARRQGRVEDAIGHFRRAHEIHPLGSAPFQELADIYLRSGENDAAVSQLRELVNVEPADYRSILVMLRLLVADDRFDAAWEACQLGGNIAPFDAARHGICGRVAIERRDFEHARQELEMELHLGADDRLETYELLRWTYEVLE
jgi:tetratricopeptide (TPR) repeat protein